MGERRGCYEVTRPTTDIKQRQELPYPHRALLFKIIMMEAATDLPAATAVKEGVPGAAEPKWYGIAVLEGVRGPGAHCMKK